MPSSLHYVFMYTAYSISVGTSPDYNFVAYICMLFDLLGSYSNQCMQYIHLLNVDGKKLHGSHYHITVL